MAARYTSRGGDAIQCFSGEGRARPVEQKNLLNLSTAWCAIWLYPKSVAAQSDWQSLDAVV